MKILGIILGTMAIFLLGRFSVSQNRTESDSTAVKKSSRVNLGEGDSRKGDRRKGASLSERIATGSRELYERELAEMMAISNWPKRRDIFEEYMESVGWLGDDVWFAHMVHPSSDEITQMAKTRTGVCHCPSSNMILASGIAPVRDMVDAGMKVALGVDGSASNDGNHMLGEARQAMLLQRVGWPGFESRADRFSAREALELATLGGARVLRREEDLGSLEVGKSADLVAFRVDGLQHAGGQNDPVASLMTCAPGTAWLSVINGQVVVEDGELKGVELAPLIERHNEIAAGMLS
mgnify:CR=1 FL=1